MLIAHLIKSWWGYRDQGEDGFYAFQAMCLTSNCSLAEFIKGSLLGLCSILDAQPNYKNSDWDASDFKWFDIPHLKIQARISSAVMSESKGHFKKKDLFPWPMLSSMSPQDRRAALRMQLVTRLFDFISQVVPSGIIIPHEKLPRLSGISSDVIMEGVYADQEDSLPNE